MHAVAEAFPSIGYACAVPWVQHSNFSLLSLAAHNLTRCTKTWCAKLFSSLWRRARRACRKCYVRKQRDYKYLTTKRFPFLSDEVNWLEWPPAQQRYACLRCGRLPWQIACSHDNATSPMDLRKCCQATHGRGSRSQSMLDVTCRLRVLCALKGVLLLPGAKVRPGVRL